MVLIWPSQIIDEIVYLDHMGKNRFLKNFKNILVWNHKADSLDILCRIIL